MVVEVKMQSRAASGFRTDWPGSAVINRWNTFNDTTADAASVIAAGSVTRTKSVLITVKGLGGSPLGVGDGLTEPLSWQPVTLSTKAQAAVSATTPRRPRIGLALAIGLLEPFSSDHRIEFRQRCDVTAAWSGWDGHPSRHGDNQGAGRITGSGTGDRILQDDALSGVDSQGCCRGLVRLRVRLAVLHLVARHRHRKGVCGQLAQHRVQHDSIGRRNQGAGDGCCSKGGQEFASPWAPRDGPGTQGLDYSDDQLVDHPGRAQVMPPDRVQDVGAGVEQRVADQLVRVVDGPRPAEVGDEVEFGIQPQRLRVNQGSVEVPQRRSESRGLGHGPVILPVQATFLVTHPEFLRSIRVPSALCSGSTPRDVSARWKAGNLRRGAENPTPGFNCGSLAARGRCQSGPWFRLALAARLGECV